MSEATEKMLEMEIELQKFMEKNTVDSDSAMYAASVLMKCAMILYTQVLGVEDTQNLLLTVSDSVHEFDDALKEADPYYGIDETLKH
jgi:hypothetical protein